MVECHYVFKFNSAELQGLKSETSEERDWRRRKTKKYELQISGRVIINRGGNDEQLNVYFCFNLLKINTVWTFTHYTVSQWHQVRNAFKDRKTNHPTISGDTMKAKLRIK